MTANRMKTELTSELIQTIWDAQVTDVSKIENDNANRAFRLGETSVPNQNLRSYSPTQAKGEIEAHRRATQKTDTKTSGLRRFSLLGNKSATTTPAATTTVKKDSGPRR